MIAPNDLTFLRSVKRNKEIKVGRFGGVIGRPQGAKDKKRRRNSAHFWTPLAIEVKFRARVKVLGAAYAQRCWIWQGATTRGFGTMIIGSRQDNGGKSPRVQAHRLAFEMFIGEIPEGDLVGQTCHNKLCVKPAHLYLWRK